MTSIVDVLTPDYVLQICEQRATPDAGGKAIFVDGAYVLSISGAVKIGEIDADAWVTARLAATWQRPMSERLQALAGELTAAFETAPLAGKRFAVVGVGWFLRPEGFQPVRVAVSNFHGPSGWLTKALPQFDVRRGLVPSGQTLLLSHAGAKIPDDVSRRVERQLRQMAKDGLGPVEIGEQLAGLVELIASHTHAPGHRITLACVPRKDVERLHAGGDLVVLSDVPNLETNAFLSYDPDQRAWEQLAPHVLARGSVISEPVAG